MITLVLNDPAMDYVFKVLATRPWGEVQALMMDLQKQVQIQQAPQQPEIGLNGGGLPMPQLGPDQPRSPGMTD